MLNENISEFSTCAIVAPSSKGTPMAIKMFENFKSLIDEYGNESSNNPIVCLSKVLFLNNVSKIYCIAPSINRTPTKEEYSDAFKILQSTSGFHSIICDSSEIDVINELVKSISIPYNNPRLAFVGLEPTFDLSDISLKSISNPRLILTNVSTFLPSSPNFISSSLTAASLAALVASIRSPLTNLNESIIQGLNINNSSSQKSISPTNPIVSSITCIKNQLFVNKLLPSKPLSSDLTPNINYLLILDTILLSIINLVNNIKKSPSFNLLTCRSLFSQIILILSQQKYKGFISDFLLPKINVTSSINISISIKPSSLFDNLYIDYDISI